MEQLSGLDNASLVGEQGNVFNHVCTLQVYDVTTAPDGKVRYKDILQDFEERLHLHPVFSNRLATVPFSIDRPYWVAGGDIDVEYHIRHIALPQPGDWR
jgi:diacylglycerol O-acyltransferase